MRQFSYLQFVLIFFILKSEVQSKPLNCDFNSDACAWYSSDTLVPTWEWTGILESDDHGGYLRVARRNTSDIDQWMSTSGLSQLTTSVHDLWHIHQPGCFTFSYQFYTTSDSKLSLTLEPSFGEKKVIWDINGQQSIHWSKASVYIDSPDYDDFRLHFTASVALKNSLGLDTDWIVSLDDFTFSNDKCPELTQNVVETKVEGTLPDIMANTGELIYTSGSVDIDKLVCFSFTYFYTITNSKNVGSLLITLEKMSSDGKQAVEPRRILPLEKISLQREFSLNRNHFERTIVVDQKSFYTISLVYADKVHSSVVLVDDVAFKMERCSNESPVQDSDITVAPATESPPPTTTECCVTDPCICVQSTPEMPTFNPSVVKTFVTPSIISTVPISTVRIDQEISSTPTFPTGNTISEITTSHSTEAQTKDQSTTLSSLSSTQAIVSTEHKIPEASTTQSTKLVKTQDQSTTLETLSSTRTIFSTENTISETSTVQSTEAQTKDQSTTLSSLSTTQIATDSQTNETPLLTTNFEPISNTTKTVEHDDRKNPFNAINFGNLGMNLITLFKFFFGERSVIASLSALAGLSILMVSILILALNWKKREEFQKRPVVLSTVDGELELNAYTFRRRTITLSRLEEMSNSKPPLKFSKGADV